MSRTVFVTGASAGFGASIARRFAADGDRVVVSARRSGRIDELAGELGDAVLPVTFDVRDRDAVAATVAGLPAEFAEIDVLVNNAGLALGLEPALRADLHGSGVRVTSVEPGLSGGTEFSVVRFGGDQEKAGQVYQGVQPLGPDDVAEAVHWAATLPPHVNINVIEMMPVAQSFGALRVARD